MKKRTHCLLGFTLLELIISVTIIALLVSISAASYGAVLKTSRDAKRKGDIEEVRAALEFYRSNSTNSNYPQTLPELTTPTVYIQRIPVDPLAVQTYDYKYTKLPAGCDNSTTYCTDYTLSALLEGASSCTPASSEICKTDTGTVCNYCTGPYGQK